MHYATEIDEALANRYGSQYLVDEVPSQRLPDVGMPAARRDAARVRGGDARGRPPAQPRDLRDHLDGARGAEDHRREPPPQLHRSRRVPADGRDRAALHPDAGRPLPRARRDHRRPHAGLLGGDHARRPLAEVELAQAPRGGRQARRQAQPRVRRRRARGVGEVLPLLRRRAADRPVAGAQVHDRARGRGAPPGREHDRGGGRARHDLHGHRDDIVGINKLLGEFEERTGEYVPLHIDAASGGFVWPFLYPDYEWDFRLDRVRSINVSGHKYGLVYPASAGWCSASAATSTRSWCSPRTTSARRTPRSR